MSKKERQAVWLYPETKMLIEKHMDADNCKSQSEYIEKAVRFYSGYLDSTVIRLWSISPMFSLQFWNQLYLVLSKG